MYTSLSPISNVRFRGQSNQTPSERVSSSTFEASVKEITELNQQAMESVPLARKLNNEKNRAISSLIGLGLGGVAGPVLGMGLDSLSGYNKPIVKISERLSARTVGFDKWFKGLQLGARFKKIFQPVKDKLFTPENYKTFMNGYRKDGGLLGAHVNLRNAAAEAGEIAKVKVAARSITTLKEVDKLGVVGRSFGKRAIALKKNLTGTMGVINGIFAAMTVSSVVNAKKGEKVSTFMEEVLGTWVGSIGGYRLFENVLRGLNEFVQPGTGKVLGKGVLPTVARIVNKIPLKGFVVPLIGAMVTSAMLQKLSHVVFGKPTREDPRVIDSVDSFNQWLKQTGWSHEEIAAVQDQVKEQVEQHFKEHDAKKNAA